MREATDVVAFSELFRVPETGAPLRLPPAQARFMREFFTPRPTGAAAYAEGLFGAPKKSLKTTMLAIGAIWVVFMVDEPYAEVLIYSNDFEQAQSRVFEQCIRLLKTWGQKTMDNYGIKITANKITFGKLGAGTITAMASDYAGAAGSNATLSIYDELWAYSTERAQRLWDESVPVPTRKFSARLTGTYAGFEGESTVLEALYKRGLQGKRVGSLYRQNGMLMAWHHEPIAPWQTPAWIEAMRAQLRNSAFRRMILNEWVSGEESFVPVEWWDRAATGRPIPADRSLPVWLGVDAGLKRDSAAVVACTWKDGKVQVVAHRIFFPVKGQPLDIEATIERTILDYAQRYDVRGVRYDPWQFARSAQTLAKANVNMIELPQSIPNLTAMSTNLFELLKGSNLIAYPDKDIRTAVQQAVAVEGSRGLKITKEKASHKIDVLVALAIAALAVVEKQPAPSVNFDPAAIGGLTRGSLRRPQISSRDYQSAPQEDAWEPAGRKEKRENFDNPGSGSGPGFTQPTAPSKWSEIS